MKELMRDKNKQVIFETPDDGKTIYVRRFGESERAIVSTEDYTYINNQIKHNMRSRAEEINDNMLWYKIRNAAKTNKALRDALEHAKLMYYLGNNNGKE